MRINITISDDLNDKLDSLSGRWGCSKSDLAAVILGQYFDGFDKSKIHEITGFIKRVTKDEKNPERLKIDYDINTKQ